MTKYTRRLFLAIFAVCLIAVMGVSYAATALRTKVQLSITGNHNSTLDLVSASVPLNYSKVVELADGTGANQANMMWTDRRTIAASTTEDLDLAGGGLLDVFGAAFSPARVKLVAICACGSTSCASAANTNDVVVGGDANAVPLFGAVTHTVAVKPGGCWAVLAPGAAGLASVTAGTGDILQVANGGAGTSVTYDVVVIGTSS